MLASPGRPSYKLSADVLPMNRRTGTGPDERGRITVTCWCERRIVAVPGQEVREGKTRSCGHPRCGP